jgi:hypothetical protein
MLRAPSELAYSALAEAAHLDLADWFEFTVRQGGTRLPPAGLGGLRFPVTAMVDGRVFESYHVDVGTGAPVVDAVEGLVAPDLLAFAGSAPTVMPCCPLTQQLAEKVHAYVRPRAGAAKTRVKDLVDILLIAERTTLDAPDLWKALQATFETFDQQVPEAMPDPPGAWRAPFRRLAVGVGLVTDELAGATSTVRRFLDPVLEGKRQGAWDPDAQEWR